VSLSSEYGQNKKKSIGFANGSRRRTADVTLAKPAQKWEERKTKKAMTI